MQVARITAPIRQLAQYLCANESLGQEGVLDQVFAKLQQEQILRLKIEVFSLDSTSVKVHPDGTGALKKTDHRPSGNREADGTPKFIWLPRMLERP